MIRCYNCDDQAAVCTNLFGYHLVGGAPISHISHRCQDCADYDRRQNHGFTWDFYVEPLWQPEQITGTQKRVLVSILQELAQWPRT